MSASIATEPATCDEDLVELGDVREERCAEPPRRTCVAAGELDRREGAGQAMNCPQVADAPGDAEKVRDLGAGLLGFAPVGVDLGADHQTEGLAHLAAVLLSELDPLVAQLRRHIPLARCDFHSGEEHQVLGDSGVSPRVGPRDQFGPDGPGFLVAVRAGEQPREGCPRVLVAAAGSANVDRTVEQIPSDAPGTPERHLGEGREAGRELLRVSGLLGQHQRRFRIANPVLAAASRAGHPCESKEDVDPLRELEARLGQRTIAEGLGGREPVRRRPHEREPAERPGPDLAGLRGADRRLEQLGGSCRVARIHAVLGGCDAPTVEPVDGIRRSNRDRTLRELRRGQRRAASASVRSAFVEGGCDLLVRADHRRCEMAGTLFEIDVELGETTDGGDVSGGAASSSRTRAPGADA